MAIQCRHIDKIIQGRIAVQASLARPHIVGIGAVAGKAGGEGRAKSTLVEGTSFTSRGGSVGKQPTCTLQAGVIGGQDVVGSKVALGAGIDICTVDAANECTDLASASGKIHCVVISSIADSACCQISTCHTLRQCAQFAVEGGWVEEVVQCGITEQASLCWPHVVQVSKITHCAGCQ